VAQLLKVLEAIRGAMLRQFKPAPSNQSSPASPERRPWSLHRTVWLIGLAIALAIAVIPPFIDPKYEFVQVGILIGLAAICLGLLVEQRLRDEHLAGELHTRLETDARELHTRLETDTRELHAKLQTDAERTNEALGGISSITRASTECREYVTQLVDNWMLIDARYNFPTFSDMRSARGQEFMNFLTELVSGTATVGVDSPYSARTRPFDNVKEYRAVSVGPLEFWKGTFGQHYLEVHRRAISHHGLKVERVFVIEDSDATIAEPILRAQVAAGITVWVLLRSRMSNIYQQHAVDQGVLVFRDDSKLLMQPLARGYGQQADRERLSAIPAEIKAAERSLELLKSHAHNLLENTPWPF
jgi:hypothetical protein